MKMKIKEFRVLIGCVVVSVAILIGNVVVSNVVYSKNLSQRYDDVQELTSTIEKNRVATQQGVTDVKASITGVDMNRVRTDDSIMEAFLKKCFTWSTADEYNKIREDLLNNNVLSGDSNFLTVVFPELGVSQDVDGSSMNDIDDGVYGQLNMTYDSLNSHVTNVNDTTYSYFAEVVVTSQVKDGTSKTGNIVVTYSVDKDGNILDLNAYTVVD